jgi:FkbM family methyltransferase
MSIKKISIMLSVLISLIFSGTNVTFGDEVNQEYFNKNCPKPRQAGNPEYFSQFYEDYILSIVFANQKQGHYVDVGANSPDYDSVTKHFYQQGWSGINIEPIKKLYDLYSTKRPRDININLGVSNKKGEIDFHILSSDLMSSGNKEFVDSAKSKGYDNKKLTIKVTTLNDILADHPIKNINFMKIDVEGMEKEVLEGIDLNKHRPELIMLEAIRPFSHKKVHEEWEHILLSNNYQFMMFDSLNRYYVAKENVSALSTSFEKAKECNSLANDIYPEFRIENVFKHETEPDNEKISAASSS